MTGDRVYVRTTTREGEPLRPGLLIFGKEHDGRYAECAVSEEAMSEVMFDLPAMLERDFDRELGILTGP